MVQRVIYSRGFGGLPVLNFVQLAKFRNDVAAVNSNIAAMGAGAEIYSDLLTWITNSNGTELPGTNQDVFDWIQGALGVNTASSFEGRFIRQYTEVMYRIRYGNSISGAQLDTLVNVASNGIAVALARDIVRNGGFLPGITGIGIDDAGSIARGLFVEPDAPKGVYAPWAGTIFFAYLGEPGFYQKWLLNLDTVIGTVPDPDTGLSTTVTFKAIPGTYDLVAALSSFQSAAVYMAITDFFDTVRELIKVTTNPFNLSQATITFFLQSYGLTSGQVPGIGSGNPFDKTLLTGPTYIAGTVANDRLTVTRGLTGARDVVVVGGPNSNTIVLSASNGLATGLIDGGSEYNAATGTGYNVVDFSQLPQSAGPMTFTLEGPSGSFLFRIEETSAGQNGSLFLYDIHSLIGGSFGNTLSISAETTAFWTALGLLGPIDLGVPASAAISNQVDLSQNLGGASFSVAAGPTPDSVLVNVLRGGIPVPAGDGVEIKHPGSIVVTAGGGDDDLVVAGDLSQSLGINGLIRFIGGSGVDFVDASALTSPEIIEVQNAVAIVRVGVDTTLKVDNPNAFYGSVFNFGAGNTIDLVGIGTATSATLNPAARNQLTVHGSTAGSVSIGLDPSHSYAGDHFIVTPDGNGGTDIRLDVVIPDLDGIGILDTATGLEWLPLTDTGPYTYNQVFNGGDPKVPAGYNLASDTQVKTLLHDFGFPALTASLGFAGASVVNDGGSLTKLFYALFGETDLPNAITAGNAAAADFTGVVGTPPNQNVGGVSVFEVRSNLAGLGGASTALYFPDAKTLNPSGAVGQNYFLVKAA